MTTNKRPLLPLLAALLLCAASVRALPPAATVDASPRPYAGLIGPLSEAQMKQQQDWDAAHKGQTTPTTPLVTDENGDPMYASPEAAGVNSLDGALSEAGLGSSIPGELEDGASIEEHGGKRSYCDSSTCVPCPGNDCSSVIPDKIKLPSGTTPAVKPGQGQFIASNGPTGTASAGGPLSLGGGVTVRGKNAGSRGDAAGDSGLTVAGGSAPGGTATTVGAGAGGSRRSDEPPAKTVSQVVEMILPAVDGLKSSSGETGTVSATGGTLGIAGVAGAKAGGATQVHYNGGSFDSLGDINKSKALGDLEATKPDGAPGAEAIKAGRTGKQTNNFGATKGENQ